MRRFVWALGIGALLLLIDFGAQSLNPGTGRSLLTRRGGFGLMLTAVTLAVLAGVILHAALAAVRDRLRNREPRFFASDPHDAEQAVANEELDRIIELGELDEPASEAAYREWLVGERRREEARFKGRRQRALLRRRALEQYERELRAEIEGHRSIEPEAGEAAEFAADIRRLEEELAWAQSELARFVGE